MKYFGVVGGDLRIAKLVEILAKENVVNVYGIDAQYITRTYESDGCSNIRFCNLKECIAESDYIISGVPFAKNEEEIHTPLFEGQIKIKDLISEMNFSKIFFAGKLSEKVQEELIQKDIKFVDLLEVEELTILNCIPTAEGAIEVALREMKTTLHDSKILILGYGRIGKILAKRLTGFGCKIFCEARKESDLAYIRANGYVPVRITNLKEELNQFDCIFNTVPWLLLTNENLGQIKKDCIVIDLASNPGGVDLACAEKLGLKVVKALGLPGKVAPVTAAKYIYDIIC